MAKLGRLRWMEKAIKDLPVAELSSGVCCCGQEREREEAETMNCHTG
jgi:hypothetical protein